MSQFDKSKIEQMLASGRIDQKTADRLMEALLAPRAEGSSSKDNASKGRRAVAVAVASGPGASASASSTGGVVKAVAGPGETVVEKSD